LNGGIIMIKPRKQTYTMLMFLEKIKEMDIRSDQDVQRLSGQWDNKMVNELVSTVLNEEYIPPIILGEEKNSQLWIIDGLQRSSSLSLFRYGNYKITSSIEEPIIHYQAKARDENGEIKVDGNGDIVWIDSEFNIKNKTYDSLPDELKKRFNEYQIETVIHEGYDMKQISKLVRRYNNHKSMNIAQRAFTYVDNYAREIRNILSRPFFIECKGYTNNERKNGTLERVIMESVMCMFHLDNWKKGKQIGEYLNEYATMEEFKILNQNLERLEKVATNEMDSVFTSKDSLLWFTLFHKFTITGLSDWKFAEFVSSFNNKLYAKEINGSSFEALDKDRNRSTKDKAVIVEKLDILEMLMCEYLNIAREELQESDTLGFIKENVNPEVTQEDIELYSDMLDSFISKVDCESKLLDKHNRPSMLAVIAYACDKDIKLDNWIIDYFSKNDTYINDQIENYQYMKYDLEDFIKITDVA